MCGICLQFGAGAGLARIARVSVGVYVDKGTKGLPSRGMYFRSLEQEGILTSGVN